MTKVFIFDFDGVILDSMPIKTYAFCKIFEEFPPEAVQKLRDFHIKNGGISRFVKIRYFFEDILGQRVDDDDVQRYADKFSVIVTEELVKPKYLIVETLEFIEKMHQAKRLFVASGAEEKELRFLCRALGIDGYFEEIYGSPTPKSELLGMILGNGKVDAKECAMIGDSINDYEAAVKNKIPFYGYNNEELRSLGKYIDSFKGFCID